MHCPRHGFQANCVLRVLLLVQNERDSVERRISGSPQGENFRHDQPSTAYRGMPLEAIMPRSSTALIGCPTCLRAERIDDRATTIPRADGRERRQVTRGTSRRDWGGWRPTLLDLGIDLGFAYASENAGVVSGGKRVGIDYTHSVAFQADVDWAKLAGMTGFSTHLAVIERAGRNTSSDYVGDHINDVQEPRTRDQPRSCVRHPCGDRASCRAWYSIHHPARRGKALPECDGSGVAGHGGLLNGFGCLAMPGFFHVRFKASTRVGTRQACRGWSGLITRSLVMHLAGPLPR
jgi:hypothetical protein